MNERYLPEEVVVEASRCLAENLPVEYAVHALNMYMTHRSASGHFHSAWNHVEMGMNSNLPINAGIREAYCDDAQYLLRRLVQGKKSSEDVRIGALTLNSYIPVFKKRSEGEMITKQDCHEVYTSLGKAAEFMQPLQPGDPPQWRMSETAVLAFSARTGNPDLLLYPSSPREEASRISRENHDHYFYADGEKLSVQQKYIDTGKQYSPHITMLVLRPMLERAFARSGCELHDLDPAEELNFILSLIIAESNGEQLEDDEKAFMDHMCRAVARHKKEAEWARRAREEADDLVDPWTPAVAVA